jgi:two-component system alkaline phosphatase synthesis response regulator PhoP
MTRTLLVVDDEEDIRLVAVLALARVGRWRVLTAGGGRQAVALALEARPDAIVMDVTMPELDGPRTLELLRQDPLTAAIPVVFLTAKVSSSNQPELDTMGCAGVIHKPFDPLTLAFEVEKVLGFGPD